MKRTLLVIVTLLLVAACSLGSIAFAETVQTGNEYKNSFAYRFIEEFTQNYPDRKAGITVNDPFYTDKDGEKSVQLFLRDSIVENSHGAVAADSVNYQAFTVYDVSKGYNLVARLDKPNSDKQVIIGAHYDGGDGQCANDNASGVAALLTVLNELSNDIGKLPCDIVFVLFDGEENGLLGSRHYVSLMSQAEKDNTLLMVNLDSVANGDNLYLWCENKRTDLAKLITGKNGMLREKPYANGTYNIDLGFGYGYVETPQNSDHTPFRMAGIPTALFFSGTYSAQPWNYAESSNPAKKVMNSANDTLENLDKYNGGEFVAKIEAAASAVVNTVLDDGFVQTAVNHRKQMINYKVLGNAWWARLIVGVIIVAFAVFVGLYYRKLQKGAILGTAEIKNDKLFGTPNAEDIFSFDDKKTDIEDIFTFDDKK